ncbi:MAG: hypothetical protein R3B92_04235 [Patescibacteria group bacterium]
MHSQLEENTRLSELLLKDVVTNIEISELLTEIWEQYRNIKIKNGSEVDKLTNPYVDIQEKLTTYEDLSTLTKEELDTIIEILRNIDKVFRTYGKRTGGTLSETQSSPIASYTGRRLAASQTGMLRSAKPEIDYKDSDQNKETTENSLNHEQSIPEICTFQKWI